MSTPITGLAYLATPYRHFPGGEDQAYIAACKLTAELLRTGISIYCPIAHSHSVATHGRLGRHDVSIWGPLARVMSGACQALLVAHLPNWELSEGIAGEVIEFEKAGKPIFDLDPQTLIAIRRRPSFSLTTSLAHDKTPSMQGGSSA